MLTLKVRVFLATAVLGLLLLAPVAPITHAGDCPTTASTGCGG